MEKRESDKNGAFWIWEPTPDAKGEIRRNLGNRPVVLCGRGLSLLTELGIETPSGIRIEPIEKVPGPWDKRGFQSYRDHPVFAGLYGGFYSLLLDLLPPPYGEVALYCGEKAKIVAVEKRFIDYLRQRPILWEYEKENIFCIGGFLYQDDRAHGPYATMTERFRRNIGTYLRREYESPVSFWPPISRGFMEERSASCEPRIENIRTMPEPSALRITLQKDQLGNYTNTSGSRILVNARDKGSIQEIWAHPYRILNRLNIEIDGTDLSESLVQTMIEPAYIRFETESAAVTLFASCDKPFACLQIDFRDRVFHRVDFHFETDLRISWPMDDDYNGRTYYGKDPTAGRVSFRTEEGRCRSWLKANHSAEIQVTPDTNALTGVLRVNATENLSLIIGANIDEEKQPMELSLEEELHRAAAVYQGYLDRTVRIRTDSPAIDRRIERAKIAAYKFRVCTPGIGTGLVAGYANSRPGWSRARPGYAWYFGRDSEWISLAMLGWGDSETVRENLELLMRYQELTGKIYHELSTSGVAHFDAADSTPLFLLTAVRMIRKTGDLNWFRRYRANLLKALEYCATTDTDNDGLIENTVAGHGWVEGGKLYVSHASLYLNAIWLAALRELSDLFTETGECPEAWASLEKWRQNVEKKFPSFYNSERERYAIGIDKEGRRLDYFTIMPAVGVHLRALNPSKTAAHVRDFAGSDFSTDWGVRIIGKSSGMYNPAGYHEGSVWPLFTGWASLAEFASGATLSGFAHVCANLADSEYFAKGTIHEVLHGEIYRSSGVCPHQGWSESMAVQPWIEGVIGFSPDALKASVFLSPQIPANLSRLAVSRLMCGKNEIAMDYERDQEIRESVNVRQRYRLRPLQTLALSFQPFIPKQAENIEITVRRFKSKTPEHLTESEKRHQFRTCYDTPNIVVGIQSARIILPEEALSEEIEIGISYQLSFELLSVVPVFIEHEPSRLPRILGWEKRNGRWAIEIEAPGNREVTLEGFVGEKCHVKGATYREGRFYCRAEGAENEYHPHTIEIEG
ncbi:MAG TPA: hypothetical protein PKW59_11855 [Thermotogota bacterium]|nr:hypothetical protein [Thermotogota bacterium]